MINNTSARKATLQPPKEQLERHVRVIRTAALTLIKVQVQKQPPAVLGTWLASECQQLGPTYVKLGQFISSRKDVFGNEFASCFDTLRDQVTPMSREEVSEVLEEHPTLLKLINVDLEPIASASIGQVHLATSKKNGRKLVVKIKRPHIEQIVEQDMMMLSTFAKVLVKLNMRDADNTVKLLDDIKQNILKESNFSQEAQNISRFYKEYQGYQTSVGINIRIPFLVPSLSSPDILVMEYIENFTSLDQLSNSDPKQAFTVARALMDFFISQLINYGIVHGDPHKGNVGVTSNGDIVLYDFGCVVTVSKIEQYCLKELVYFLVAGNKKGIMDTLEQLDVQILDRSQTTKYIDTYIQYMRSLDIKLLQALVQQQTPAPPVIPVKFSAKILRIIKIYGILEGVCKELDPSFNYFVILDNYISTLLFDEDFLIHKSEKDISMLFNSFFK
jgi:ubiquinone biosynthesis protein